MGVNAHVQSPDRRFRGKFHTAFTEPAKTTGPVGCCVGEPPTGSTLIALALMRGVLSPEAAWQAAHVDEDWNMEQWGKDEIALRRRSSRFAEFAAAALVLGLLRER